MIELVIIRPHVFMSTRSDDCQLPGPNKVFAMQSAT